MATTGEKPKPSAVERIAQLNDIDRDVAKLLHSAGLAIKTLTSSALEEDEKPDTSDQSIAKRKERFAAASSQYFSLLSSVDVRLRRQISALEQAEILPSEVTAKESQTSSDATSMHISGGSLPRTVGSSKDTTTNGGLGNLDVSWLNSRNNKVENDMEAELWEGAHHLVQKILEAKTETDGNGDMTMSSEATALPG
ncbi:MAG: hypothetical protein Q9218_000460 [Villophora microphyllina]